LTTSAVATRLFQGSVPIPGSQIPCDLLILCAEEFQFPGANRKKLFGHRATVLHCPLTDMGQPLSPHRIRDAFNAAVEAARVYLNGGTVVITCAAGLNRSGLVMALTLLELGVEPRHAIDVIRRARPGALCNPHFEQLILNMRGRSLVRFPVASASTP
jgi:hypothetical protein